MRRKVYLALKFSFGFPNNFTNAPKRLRKLHCTQSQFIIPSRPCLLVIVFICLFIFFNLSDDSQSNTGSFFGEQKVPIAKFPNGRSIQGSKIWYFKYPWVLGTRRNSIGSHVGGVLKKTIIIHYSCSKPIVNKQISIQLYIIKHKLKEPEILRYSIILKMFSFISIFCCT